MSALPHVEDGQHGAGRRSLLHRVNTAPVKTHSASSSAVAVLLFLLADSGSLNHAQNPTANPNPQIGADQLVHEVIQNELQAQAGDQTNWRYTDLKEEDGRKELRDVIGTKDGDVDRLLAVNGQPLTPAQDQMEDARIQRLLANPDKIRKEQQKQREDDQSEIQLLQSFSSAFFYKYDGLDGGLVRLTFTPNPHFRPSKREVQVFHHMEGTIWIDVHQKRLVEIDGRLTSEVRFGAGLLGHLDKGGAFSVRLKDLGSGHWDLDSLTVQLQGKALLFKTINLQQKERRTNYRRIRDDVTLQQAAQLLQKESSASVQPVVPKSTGNQREPCPLYKSRSVSYVASRHSESFVLFVRLA
jgi:hypothetical protein